MVWIPWSPINKVDLKKFMWKPVGFYLVFVHSNIVHGIKVKQFTTAKAHGFSISIKSLKVTGKKDI